MSLFINPSSEATSAFLMQVIITLLLSKLLAKALSYIRQPQVVGQIIAGIMLGPSVLGYIPGFTSAVFPHNTTVTFSTIANLGLIFFMFFLGLELDPLVIRNKWKSTLPLACASIIIPVGVGAAASIWLKDINGGMQNDVSFILLIGAGIGFSAFPVLAALLNATGLLTQPIGVQTISLAAVEDITVWVVLAIASAFSTGGSALNGLYTLLLTFAFVAIMVFPVRMVLCRLHAHYLAKQDEHNIYLVVLCFMILVGASFTTEVMQIHAFFGAFIAGLIIPRQGTLTDFIALRMELVVIEFFLPLYFANSGLNTQLGLLNDGASWWTLVVLVVLATAAKVIPVSLMARAVVSKDWRYCMSIGLLMNTRGIVQLVVLNIGVELGILSPKLFAIFVLMATILTFMTSPLLSMIYHNPYKTDTEDKVRLAEEFEMIRRAVSEEPQVYLQIQPVVDGKVLNLNGGVPVAALTAMDTQHRKTSHSQRHDMVDSTKNDTHSTDSNNSPKPNGSSTDLTKLGGYNHHHTNSSQHTLIDISALHNSDQLNTDPEVVSKTSFVNYDPERQTHEGYCCSAAAELAVRKKSMSSQTYATPINGILPPHHGMSQQSLLRTALHQMRHGSPDHSTLTPITHASASHNHQLSLTSIGPSQYEAHDSLVQRRLHRGLSLGDESDSGLSHMHSPMFTSTYYVSPQA